MCNLSRPLFLSSTSKYLFSVGIGKYIISQLETPLETLSPKIVRPTPFARPQDERRVYDIVPINHMDSSGRCSLLSAPLSINPRLLPQEF